MSAPTRQTAYPLPRADDDPRFNMGLTADIVRVLEAHDYPKVTEGRDIVRLQQVLFDFLYGEA